MPGPSNNSVAAGAQALAGSERRTEARYPTEDPVELECMPGPSESIVGTVVDVSRSGLRVKLPKSIERGAQVKLKLQANVIFGEVRYCRSISGHFEAGIRIEELVHPSHPLSEHVSTDLLSAYATGRGLAVPEIIQVREHLRYCDACRTCLAQKQAMLHDSGSPKPRPSLA